MIDWSIVLGIATGLGLPGIAFTIGAFRYVVRQDGRLAVLEGSRDDEAQWRRGVDETLRGMARDLNQLLGARRSRE